MKREDELLALFEAYIAKLTTDNDSRHLRAAVQYMSNLTQYLLENEPEVVEEAMDIWHIAHVNNYLTQVEAHEAITALINITGEPNPKWKHAALFDTLKSIDMPLNKEHVYNDWALYYTMHWLYSDYATELHDAVGGNTMELMKLICKMAISKLQDPDNTHWVRDHLKLDK